MIRRPIDRYPRVERTVAVLDDQLGTVAYRMADIGEAPALASPIYHHTCDPSKPNSTIVFAALAVSHCIETQTGWSIKKFVHTTRRYRTLQIKARRQILARRQPPTTGSG